MLNKIHEILRDPECRGNIKAVTWAAGMTTLYVCTFVYGFAWFDFAAAERKFDNRVAQLEKTLDWTTKETVRNQMEFHSMHQEVVELKQSIMPSAFKGKR